MSKNFCLIGSAGFIAPRHLKAIKDTGNNLLASLDRHDCVGVIDGYFPDADFFIEYERFDRHIDKLKRQGIKMDYVSICTPNYLHDSHIRFALRHGADAICEKPIVLNPWNIDALTEIEKETGRRVNTILQLRHHPSIVAMKKMVEEAPKDKIFDIDLAYITSRGRWYSISWKGDIQKSGGVATNIGVHFFDMLTWIFGDVQENVVHVSQCDKAAGYLSLKRARVRWFLSVDFDDVPNEVKALGQRTYRSITIEGNELEFSGGFADLHTVTYQEILNGRGYGLADSKMSIQTVHHIRNTKAIGLIGDYHPYCKNVKSL
jgi:UDP-N-acetyl-2-amino-2-deoxyglucuronate dehydrogenase